jgi:transcriptional regulator with XRE-family HTH domain
MAMGTAVFSPEAFMEALRNADMTPAQFAEELGVGPGQVAKWMVGLAEPRPANIKWAAKILRVKESDLLEPAEEAS